jgi:hypothetical protein
VAGNDKLKQKLEHAASVLEAAEAADNLKWRLERAKSKANKRKAAAFANKRKTAAAKKAKK